LSAEKRHYLPVDPGQMRQRNGASDDFSRYCVQMLRMFLNATRSSADERQADAIQVV
jgi:hypothetical protein